MDVSGTLRTPTGSCKVVGSIIYLKKHTHNQKMDERYEKGGFLQRVLLSGAQSSVLHPCLEIVFRVHHWESHTLHIAHQLFDLIFKFYSLNLSFLFKVEEDSFKILEVEVFILSFVRIT